MLLAAIFICSGAGYSFAMEASEQTKQKTEDASLNQRVCGGYIHATINNQPVSIPRHKQGRVGLENGELIEPTNRKCDVTDLGKVRSIAFPNFSLGIIRENFEPQQNSLRKLLEGSTSSEILENGTIVNYSRSASLYTLPNYVLDSETVETPVIFECSKDADIGFCYVGYQINGLVLYYKVQALGRPEEFLEIDKRIRRAFLYLFKIKK